MEAITEEEVGQVKQLRERIADEELGLGLTKEELQNKNLVRWLRARKHNLDAAELMLRKHQEWRKEIDIEAIVRKEDPPGFNERYPWRLCGLDKYRNPVAWAPVGTWDFKKAMVQGQREDLEHYVIKLMELVLRGCRFVSTGQDKWMGQMVLIYDCAGLSFSQVTCYEAIQSIYSICYIFINNYPELLGRLLIVNTHRAFQIAYRLLRPIVDERTMAKVMILGSNATLWREEIGKQVPFDQFPKKYGGDLDDDFEHEQAFDGVPFDPLSENGFPTTTSDSEPEEIPVTSDLTCSTKTLNCPTLPAM